MHSNDVAAAALTQCVLDRRAVIASSTLRLNRLSIIRQKRWLCTGNLQKRHATMS
jgi:hypothetical protein